MDSRAQRIEYYRGYMVPIDHEDEKWIARIVPLSSTVPWVESLSFRTSIEEDVAQMACQEIDRLVDAARPTKR